MLLGMMPLFSHAAPAQIPPPAEVVILTPETAVSSPVPTLRNVALTPAPLPSLNPLSLQAVRSRSTSRYKRTGSYAIPT
jgi:hypothetical protein